jgi:hypothetical protein
LYTLVRVSILGGFKLLHHLLGEVLTLTCSYLRHLYFCDVSAAPCLLIVTCLAASTAFFGPMTCLTAAKISQLNSSTSPLITLSPLISDPHRRGRHPYDLIHGEVVLQVLENSLSLLMAHSRCELLLIVIDQRLDVDVWGRRGDDLL